MPRWRRKRSFGAGVGLAGLWVSRQLWCSKVSKGERREAGIQWIQPPKAVSDRSFRQTTSGAHGSANRADCLPRGKPFGAPVGIHLPLLGLDAPTPARTVGLPPRGGSTFFRSERKYQRKHAARRLREKALYCPFLKEGVRNVARNLVGELTHAIVRARAHSFPLSKRARLFPSPAYRRSASPPHGWGWSAALAGWAVTARHGRFSRGAGQRVWETASAGGASREARCRAAVTPQPSCMSFDCSALKERGVGCRAARGSACPVGTTAVGG